MSRAVSIVVPCAGSGGEAFERCVAALLEEVDRRRAGDEVIVVDDSGADELRPALVERHAALRVVARDESGGFAAAALDGARAGACELLFLLHPGVLPRPGFLAPLERALEDEEIFAACPRVAPGPEARPRGVPRSLCVEEGRLRVVERETEPAQEAWEEGGAALRDVTFASGGALMLRRTEFLEAGGFDAVFAPLAWEDVDLCLRARRQGLRVVEVARATVEWGAWLELDERRLAGAPEHLLQASIEKNRLLAHWKYFDTKREAYDHLATLWRDALDAGMAGRRRELTWMALALEQLPELNASRAALPDKRLGLQAILRGRQA